VIEPDSQAAANMSGNLSVVSPEGSPRGELGVGASAGDYVVTSLIARGGCGAVYRAHHRTRDRSAAVKVLHAPLAVMPKMVERFAREVQVVGMLRHPSIVEIYDIGSLADHRPYYAMEYLSGRTLSTILDQQGRLSPAEALVVLEPVCAALAAAHAAGVIHRDVKASNIMVDGTTGAVKLLDFGIAKLVGPGAAPIGLTSEGRQVGTLTIMAPEQLLGGPVDARIDIYALGVLLYRLLTGRLPFDGKNALTLAQQHLEEPAPRPSHRIPVAPAFDALVLRCLEKRPEKRYATVEAFLEALRNATQGARRRENTPLASAPGVGVYLEIRMRAEGDDIDDALVADAGYILDLAEETLREQGFLLAAVTGSSVLGVRVLPDETLAAADARADAVLAAAHLHEAVSTRDGADPRVHANVCVHADLLMWRTGDAQISGGPLVRPEAWAPRSDVLALCATTPAVEGLTDLTGFQGFDLTPGPTYAGAEPSIPLLTVTRTP
jgi:hypothetical protein